MEAMIIKRYLENDLKSRQMIINKNNTDFNELSVKIIDGVNKALRKLTETSAANNQNLIVSDKDGNVKSVPAKELLKTLPK